MTTVGHSLTGASLAVLTLPRGRSLGWYVLIGHLFVVFANVPDLPLPSWGHARYEVSHSVFVTLALALVLFGTLMTWPRARRQLGPRIFLALTAAWLSHMLLDSFYSHGRGLAIYWPFSAAHLALPIPWFETVRLPFRSDHNRRVVAIEAAVYGTILVVCILWRRRAAARGYEHEPDQPG